MKTRMIVVVLMTAAVLASSTLAQEPPDRRPNPGEDAEYQHHLRQLDLEFRAQETELEFQRQIQELELEERRAEVEQRHGQSARHKQKDGGGGAVFLVVCLVINILLTVWVYQDIRERNRGSGLWVAITLVTGFLGALLYALVRLGDLRKETS